MRCFIAINLPNEIKNELDIVLNELELLNKDLPVKWTKRKNWHITIHFLGELSSEEVDKTRDVLENLSRKYLKSRMSLDGFGVLPGPHDPKIIYAGVREVGGKILHGFADTSARELEAAGIDFNFKKWMPHITLGRIKKRGSKIDFKNIKISPLEFEVSKIYLMKSELDSSGPEYSVVREFDLA